MSSSVYVAVPIMVILAVLQTAVLPLFPILGLVPLLPFLVAIAWGLQQGVNEGVLWAFIAGFALDLFSAIPLGSTSIAFIISIFIVIWAGQVFPSGRFFLPMIQSTLATLIFLFIYMPLLQMLNHQVSLQAITVLAPLALLHGVLILPIYWLIRLLYPASRRQTAG